MPKDRERKDRRQGGEGPAGEQAAGAPRATPVRADVRKPSGRRAGESGTRAAVLAAAERQFSELGYARTTMRSVALEAGVDQKLVAYFFGSKQRLFVAATQLPVRPAEALPLVLGQGSVGAGERLAALAIGILEGTSTGGRMIGIIRAAATEPQAAEMVRDLLTNELLAPAAVRLPADQPELRVALVASQLVGFAMARYILHVEPLASLPVEELQACLAPTLQRYLAAPLGLSSPERGTSCSSGGLAGHEG